MAEWYNRICSMLGDGRPRKEKVKYQRIAQIEEKLNQIMQSQNISLRNTRLSSHECQRRVARQQETPMLVKTKKVMFQYKQARTSLKKEANTIPVATIKSRKNLVPSNMKTFKSLNCSFVGNLTRGQSNKSNRSILTINSELPECKRIVSEIIQKISVFLQTQVTHKQIIEWLQLYCERQRNILYKLFVKVRKLSSHKNKKTSKLIITLQLDEDVIHARLELKMKDGMNGLRFVTANQLSQLSEYLQHTFAQKLRIKTKQFEESIGSKLRTICEKIRKQQDNQYILNVRKKPVEISDFLVDVAHFENNCGQLKKITSLNRIRFKMLNDTDLVINRQSRQINQIYRSHKQSITLIE